MQMNDVGHHPIKNVENDSIDIILSNDFSNFTFSIDFGQYFQTPQSAGDDIEIGPSMGKSGEEPLHPFGGGLSSHLLDAIYMSGGPVYNSFIWELKRLACSSFFWQFQMIPQLQCYWHPMNTQIHTCHRCHIYNAKKHFKGLQGVWMWREKGLKSPWQKRHVQDKRSGNAEMGGDCWIESTKVNILRNLQSHGMATCFPFRGREFFLD
ncbi:unnamed protein product [Lactuca saligna]|uniref:Uncharacterized protein n=1 Tax=Lactuca saligna TaxID=75948 RepID=A0AA36EQJ3_LACSI|nr:unnamed protein product [Lactuca saligna]